MEIHRCFGAVNTVHMHACYYVPVRLLGKFACASEVRHAGAQYAMNEGIDLRLFIALNDRFVASALTLNGHRAKIIVVLP